MLWLPFGQHAFLLVHWMKVGTFMAPFLLLVAFSLRAETAPSSDPRTLALVLLVAYIVHQFEEHWIDLFGRVFAFKPYLNNFLSGVTGQSSGTEIVSDAAVFVINTSLVWLVAALAIWRGAARIFATLCMAAIVVVNAISHIAAGVVSSGYNPGLLTAVLVFLPVGGFVYATLLRTGRASVRLVLLSLLWGVLAHVIMIGGFLLLNRFDQLPELAYFAILVLWSIIPAVTLGGATVGTQSVT
ncbi:MAG: HXXEE domain-containing protein [Pseudomonadota bacterium]